jgi:hypothetical protein
VADRRQRDYLVSNQLTLLYFAEGRNMQHRSKSNGNCLHPAAFCRATNLFPARTIHGIADEAMTNAA